uniref:Uncharacterized protein n=1 Tax=Hucho hucho TaxID=62062 RepID=A0A4W5KD14_9TELE
MKEMRQQQAKECFKGRGPMGRGKMQPQSGGGTGPQKGVSKPQSNMVTKEGSAKTQSAPSGQGRKDELPPPQPQAKAQAQQQAQKQGWQYSGFQTTSVLEHVELEDGKKRRKVLSLPSHRGPKIRARDKGKPALPAQPKKPRIGPSRRERQGGMSLEKPTHPRTQSTKGAKRRFRSREDDRFDNLVEQYKRKLMGGNKTAIIKKNKWFNTVKCVRCHFLA